MQLAWRVARVLALGCSICLYLNYLQAIVNRVKQGKLASISGFRCMLFLKLSERRIPKVSKHGQGRNF
jgi:hypothetical protein